jgi:hypothetical protein
MAERTPISEQLEVIERPVERAKVEKDWPMIRVSWDDITKEYLPWLSAKTDKPGVPVRDC